MLLICSCLVIGTNAGEVELKCGADKWNPEIFIMTEEQLALTEEYFKNYQDCFVLSIRNVDISDIADGTFGSMSKLDTLRLENAGISDLKSTFWTGLGDSLTHLYLKGNNFPTLEANTFSGLSKLWLLNLENCGIKNINAQAFAGLPDLMALTLTGNPLDSLDENMFGSAPLRDYFGIWFDCDSMTCSQNLCWIGDKIKSGEIRSSIDWCETKCDNNGKTVMKYFEDECS